MEHYGIEMKGDFIGEKVSSNPSWTASDEGRLIYNLSDGYYYYGSDVAWVKFAKNSDLTAHASSDGTDHANVVLNDTHRGSDGTDHDYIDQDVTSGSSPTFDGSNFTNVFPSGGIIMWSGAISNIPSGWYLCDGNNSTPNLTDRFVIHADADSGGTNDVGDTGGSNTISEAQLPSHSHGDGSLSTNDDSHSHGGSSLSIDNYSHSHGDGSLSIDNDSHSHGGSSLSTNTTGSHVHVIEAKDILGGDNLFETVQGEHSSMTDSTNSAGNHSHTVSGNTDPDTHSHGISGNVDTDTHSHGISGNVDTDTHSHDVTGSTGSTGSGSDFKPKYYALAYIMKG